MSTENSSHEPSVNNIQIPELTLSTGARIPQLGFGTFKVPAEDTYRVVSEALQVGYRHIDTAQMYRNEAQVGEALEAAMNGGIQREDLFITTKLNNDYHEPKEVLRSFDQSLRDLRVDAVDLFLIHWPLPGRYDGRFDETWKAMIEIFESGRSKAIGVSNFEQAHLDKIISATDFVPHVNQIQVHPYLRNDELREYCAKLGIIVEAWSPLARGEVLQDPVIVDIAKRLQRTEAQVVLRWALERGDVIFPKSMHMERMKQNMDLFDFSLAEEDMKAINALDKGEDGRLGTHPNEANFLNR